MRLAGLNPRAAAAIRRNRRRHRAPAVAARIGFERTLQQDAAFGIRQLVDVACKALSPAVNDPYTAVQAVDHLLVIFCALAGRPLGTHVARGSPTFLGPLLVVMEVIVRHQDRGALRLDHLHSRHSAPAG